MKFTSRKFSWKAKGQSMFVIIVALPAVVGSLTLVMDVGNLYYNKLCMQTAMDSGVLSGALYLPSDPDQAKSVAEQYAILNGLKQSEIVSVSVTPDDKAVMMTSRRNLPCYFCQVLGEGIAYGATSASSTTQFSGLQASATALIEPIRSATGVVPIGVDSRTTYQYNDEVQLKSGQVGAGDWEPMAFGGDGAAIYETNVQDGYSGLVSIGDWDMTEPGDVVGPTRAAIANRISLGENQYSTDTFQHHALSDPRLIVVPIVNFANVNGKDQVPIMGFAVLWLESVDGQGDITCRFIQQSIPNAQPDPTAASGGATAPALIN